jgi:heme exporter protein B
MIVLPPVGRQLVALMGKELALEGRAGVRLNTLLPFAVLVLLLFSLAVGPVPALLCRLAPAFIWLALLLASVLSLAQSQAVEAAHDAQEGLRLLGIGADVLYLAKALANTLFLSALGFVLLPLAMALYDAPVAAPLWRLAMAVVLGAGAISAPGTLFAALTAQARNKDMLLPLLLFPILVPGLLASVRLTTLLMQGDPMQEASGWLGLLLIFNALYWLLGVFLFERVVEG